MISSNRNTSYYYHQGETNILFIIYIHHLLNYSSIDNIVDAETRSRSVEKLSGMGGGV